MPHIASSEHQHPLTGPDDAAYDEEGGCVGDDGVARQFSLIHLAGGRALRGILQTNHGATCRIDVAVVRLVRSLAPDGNPGNALWVSGTVVQV